ncbi:MAG: L-threonylcarbamoyladenylate synthase [Cyanobium sp. M30B3]|jgi:L-threonylcarbamoyladenylate synthase|nr:MAG: L-threonylcarbamoyladenylate synthase [Cyanobium sp. M30B3]
MTQDPLSAALPAAALAERLTAGAVALMPTDTLPALAARPAFASRIWELKQRPLDKPLILMGANLDQFEAVLGVPWRPEWLAMAAQGWPGPLTLVLPARGGPMDQLHPGGRSLGLRIPACAEARELLGCSGVLATTSANPSGAAAARDAEAARRFFPGLPLLGPIPWPAGSGLASTVLAWQEDGGGAAGRQGWRVLRQGAFVLPDRLP